MRKFLIISFIILLKIQVSYSTPIFANRYAAFFYDSTKSKKQVISLYNLIQIFQLKEKKNENDILSILKQSDSTWKYKGKDKSEIVFSINSSLKGVLTWKIKENALQYIFFNKEEMDAFSKEIVEENFKFIRETITQEKAHLMIYVKNDIVLKIVNPILKESGNYFILSFQKIN